MVAPRFACEQWGMDSRALVISVAAWSSKPKVLEHVRFSVSGQASSANYGPDMLPAAGKLVHSEVLT